MSDYYEKVGVENNDSSDDESVPLFKPEVPYTGSSTLMRKVILLKFILHFLYFNGH